MIAQWTSESRRAAAATTRRSGWSTFGFRCPPPMAGMLPGALTAEAAVIDVPVLLATRARLWDRLDEFVAHVTRCHANEGTANGR